MSKESRTRRSFREGVEDFTSSPERLTRMIDAGRCSAIVNFHILTDEDGRERIGMLAGGMTGQDVFDAVCIVRRSMMLMRGYVEAAPSATVASGDLVADDEPVVPPLPHMLKALFPADDAAAAKFVDTYAPDLKPGPPTYVDAYAPGEPVKVIDEAAPVSEDAYKRTPRRPDPCQACGRDYWSVLAKCEHVGCPKGLYSR